MVFYFVLQNRKLGLRLQQRLQLEEDLRRRIDQLEKRQTQDDGLINVINRYWTQFDEDIRILLQRFDAETGDEAEKRQEDKETTSFLAQLATWHKEELDEKLAARVQVSQRAVAKIIQVFDHLNQRNNKIAKLLGKQIDNKEDKDGDDANDKGTNEEAKGDGDKTNDKDEEAEKIDLPVEIVELNNRLQKENSNLHRFNTSLHEQNHFQSLKYAHFEERIAAEETKNEELQNKVDDLDYELTKCRMRNEKLETTLSEYQEKLKMYVEKDTSGFDQKTVLTNAERKTVDQMHRDLEEQRELAANRLAELEEMNGLYKDALKEVERLKMELSTLPEHVVVETTEHKCLQSQFSVLYNEAMQLKTQLEDSRNQMQMGKNAHLRQIEQMESEELLAQKKLRTEVIQLEDMLAQVRKEYEMLRIEFEQNLAANEQTGPINKEMRNLITSLQTHNVQLKGEVSRHKRKAKEAQSEIAKLRRDLEETRNNEIKALQQNKKAAQLEEAKPVTTATTEEIKTEVKEEVGEQPEMKPKVEAAEETSGEVGVASETASSSPQGESADKESEEDPVKTLKGGEEVAELKEAIEELNKARAKDQEQLKELRSQLKKGQNDFKEMKLLLDMYKACTKEQREKAQIMVAERKARGELEEAKKELKRMGEAKREDKKRLVDEDASRRIKHLEEQCAQLQKQVANHKQEEQALLSDMEVTGQAFEDVQEQNSRLIQQLREKDDANFKLMSERIKSNQIQRLAREERDMLVQQVNTLNTQVEAQNAVVRKLEEKERLLHNNLQAVDKELSMRQQAMEMHKRKAIESAQSAADLKLHLEKYHAQIKEVQTTVSEKTSSLEAEAFKTKRLHEELVLVKRKVERLRKIEMASDMDEILKEEIREYKETLTCPSCKVKRKDAVLTKCFHCFCYDCLRTRYETRQRKCPKCNAAFGASDYHRLYLS